LEGREPWTQTIPLDMDGRLMHNSALTLLILAILANSASANDEIKRLMADLSFGEVMNADDKVPASKVPASKKAEPNHRERVQSEPVVGGMTMPALPDTFAPVPVMAMPSTPIVKTVLEDPIPDSMPQFEVNLIDVANALPADIVTIPPMEAQSVGHRHQNAACQVPAYETRVVCRPRGNPNLPTSTFLQYFRGNPCYSNVWNGYRYDCGPHHAHLHGECDCFKGKKAGCESCDAKTRR